MWRTEQRQVGGRSLAWRRAGTGPPVVYLHDGGAETLVSAALDDLAADHDVVVPWLPGYGRSQRPGPETTPEGMGAMVAALVDELGWSAATVAGTSLGGWFALEAALVAPHRVAALVLCDPAGMHVPEDYLLWLFVDGHAADQASRLPAALATALPAEERDGAGDPPALAAAVLGPFVQALAAAAGCGWHPALANPRLAGRLCQVRCPTTIVWGAEDPLIPVAHGQVMAAAMPRARLDVLDGVGHLPPLDAPAAVAAPIRRAAGGSTLSPAPAATLGRDHPTPDAR